MPSMLLDSLACTEDLYRRVCGEASVHGVYLYGAGFVGRWSVGYLESAGIRVLGFVDSDELKWGSSVLGKRVLSPTDPEVVKARLILMTSRHAVPAIQKSLSHLSATLMSVDAFVVHKEGELKINQIESLLSHDPRSLETFRAVLVAMLEGSTNVLAPYADSRPFFDRFGFFNRDGEIFVDAGAYVGDSLERFIWSVNGVFRHIHAFEPGQVQFKAMERRVRRLVSEWALSPDRISLVNKGISAESGVLRVSEGASRTQTCLTTPGSDKGAVPGEVTHTVSLDEYFGGDEFTLLKVDVEGSEAKLLEGAADSIAKYRPRIALSVYHFPPDIFNLPLHCRTLNPDYSFSLGHHSFRLMETILYCRDIDD